jgi:hypothetical protein
MKVLGSCRVPNCDLKVGKVYKIITRESNVCYVGSTFDKLSARMGCHRSAYKTQNCNGKSYYSVFDLFERYGVENCKIVLIKAYPVIDRKHLLAYETLWINKLRSINKIEPFTVFLKRKSLTKKQINTIFNGTKNNYFKEYYQNNREHILQKQKQKKKCDVCNIQIRSDSMKLHLQSKRHLNNSTAPQSVN